MYVQIYSVCFYVHTDSEPWRPPGPAQRSAPYLPLRTTVMNKHGRGRKKKKITKMKITEWNLEEAGAESTAGGEGC